MSFLVSGPRAHETVANGGLTVAAGVTFGADQG
jgi:hypothetical protein